MTKNRRNNIPLLYLLLALLVISGCSIKKKKNSSFTANFSTRYNILFNSKSLLQQAQRSTEEASIDNLQQALPVFKEPNVTSIQQNLVLMDSVMGKADEIITEKQDSKYVEQAFLIKGKASYYKGDYFNANEFFGYIQKNAEDKPTLQLEAILWQIRSLIQLDNLSEANRYLEEAIAQSVESKHFKDLLFATQAKYSLKRGDKDAAIEQLSKAIESSKRKKEKHRWQYLLGQLLFEKGEDELAYSNFSKVAKSNESYEMIFHANLYRIEILNKSNPTLENRVKLLRKLLRDGKNKDYKGQIYQRIADSYLAEQHFEEAIEHYELANHNTVNNPFQQAINYQKLADLYFDQGEYAKSVLYYDSTLLVSPKDNPAYEQVSLKQKNLESLIQQLTTIAYQDTLIMLSSLTPEEREKTIDEIILKSQTPAPNLKAKNQQKQQAIQLDNNFASQSEESGSFYFSSPAAISQGYSVFKKRWGNRLLSDNWRYSNQTNSLSSSETEIALLNDETKSLENDSLMLQAKYLQDLPDTPEKLSAAESTIKHAYLALAEIYQNNLLDEEAAIKTYETYLSRFESDENTPLLCFHLYRLYEESAPEKSLWYRQKLLKEFPNSKYSQVIIDPDYYRKQQDLVEKFNDHYNTAYSLFSSQKYNELIQQANEIMQNKSFNALENNMAQLTYLRALAIGRTAAISDFKASLLTIVDDYPEEEIVVPLVKQHLVYIENNEAQFQNKAIALEDLDLNKTPFEKEFVLTPWPELSYSKEYNIPIVRKTYAVEQAKTASPIAQSVQEKTILGNKNIDIGDVNIIRHENSYRDMKLFPDSANYFFVINVMHGSVNLSPSRYGIGQFNRAQYPTVEISHQLKNIANENQLVYIGVFNTFAEVKAYEEKIVALLSNIMKIPEDSYTSFIVNEAVFNTFANFDQIDNYNTLYQTEQ